MREGVRELERIEKILKKTSNFIMKTNMKKKSLLGPTVGVFDFMLESAGGPGGSPKCKKEAPRAYQKNT